MLRPRGRSAVEERPRFRFGVSHAPVRSVSIAIDYQGETEDEVSLMRRAEDLISGTAPHQDAGRILGTIGSRPLGR